MSDIMLGLLAPNEAQRDAIHVAVCPVSSDETLQPGQHVALVAGSTDKVGVSNANKIGIVDPFLRNPVQPGQRFWLLLYLKTITSLRHEWTHPSFPAKPAVPIPSVVESEDWLRKFCDRHEGLDYDEVISEMWKNESYVVQNGGQSAQDEGVTHEFAHHFKVVTGKEVKGFFRCSC